MARKKLTVHRKAYKRKAYKRKAYTRKGGIRVKASRVPATRVGAATFKIKDVGAVGRGKKIIKIKRRGALKRLGYTTKKSPSMRRSALKKAVKMYGANTVLHMLNAQIRFREKAGVAGEVFRPNVRETGMKFKSDRNWIVQNYKISPPRKAIAAWKSLPHSVRVRKERLGKGLPLSGMRSRSQLSKMI